MQSAATKLLIILLNAATGIVTARALAPTGRGELATMIFSYGFLSSAFSLGLPSAITFSLRKYPEKSSSLLAAALVWSMVASCVIGVICYALMPYWIPQYSPTVLLYSRIFILNTPIAMFFSLGRSAVESRGNFRISNMTLAISPFITLLGLGLLALLHKLTPVSAAFCYVLSGLFMLYHLARALHRDFHPRLIQFADSSRQLLSYGVRSYGIDLCGTLSIYVDQALVVRLLSPDMMGIYIVALSLSRLLNMFHTSVVMVLFPRAVNRSSHEVLAMTGKAVRITTLMTSICGIVVMAIGPVLLMLLYGKEYSGALMILRILVVEVVLTGATQVLSQAFMALGRPGVITTLQVIGLSLTVPLMLLLIPRYGITGAALALLLSTCARFTFVLLSFPVYLHLPVPNLLIRWNDIRSIAHHVSRTLPGFAGMALSEK